MGRRKRPGGGPRRDVGLALRADRRRKGKSQRGYAAERGIGREMLAKAEVDAGALRLDALLGLLEGTGYELAVVQVDGGDRPTVSWDETDLLATTRAGSRFPAHRKVRQSSGGPLWWYYHEYFGNRGFGPPPAWTAEGFIPPEGTRYGKEPRPFTEEEGPRWPF